MDSPHIQIISKKEEKEIISNMDPKLEYAFQNHAKTKKYNHYFHTIRI